MNFAAAATETDLPVITGRDVSVVRNGETLIQWDTISIKREISKWKTDNAGKKYDGKCVGKRNATASVKGKLGEGILPTTLGAPGDEIQLLDITIAEGSIMPEGLDDPAEYGKCRIINDAYELKDEPGTYQQDWEWGFDD